MGEVAMGEGWGAKPRPLRPRNEVSSSMTRAKKTATTKVGPVVGLIRAVDRFDPTDGNRLSTYAVWWIRQSVGRAIANHARSVRVPVHVWERIAGLGRAEAQLCVETGRDPTEEELDRRPGWDVRRVRYTVAFRPDASSLDAPSGDAAQESETALGDLIADEVDVEAFALRVLLAEQLREALVGLTELQRRVLEFRYGLDGNRPATLAEAADVVGFSGEWVRLVQRRAENDLRRALGAPANGKTSPAASGSRTVTGMPLVKRGGGRECSVQPPVANLG